MLFFLGDIKGDKEYIVVPLVEKYIPKERNKKISDKNIHRRWN
jgi:hypothetical protein